MRFAKGSVDSPYGVIYAGWEKEGEEVRYRFRIPANTRASLILKGRQAKEYGSGSYEVTFKA